MTLQRAYLLLCGFYTLLIGIGILALLLGAGGLPNLVQVAVGAVAVLGLWGHTLGRGYLNPRLWRPLAGLLAAGILLQLGAALALPLSATALTWCLAGAIFSVLPVRVLYRYGNRDQELWASPAEREQGERLEALLEAQREVVMERRDADRHAQVRVVKAGNEYRAHVTRRRAADQEAFEERFHRPATLVYFLEKFADLSVHEHLDETPSGDGANPA